MWRRTSPKFANAKLFPETVSVTTVTLVAALFFVLTANQTLWVAVIQAAQLSATHNTGFAAAIFVFLAAAFSLVISLFGFKTVFKPALILLFFIAAASGYFMDTYGVVIDSGMLQNTLETDPNEAQGLLSFALLWHLTWAAVVPSLLVWRLPIVYQSLPRQILTRALTAVVAITVGFGAIYSHYKDFTLIGRSNHGLRYLINPTYPIYAAGQLAASKFKVENTHLTVLGQDAVQVTDVSQQAKNRLVVFVVGETARAANFSLDGYTRETNAELAKQDIINFGNVSSCGTATAVSLPCMFSRQDRKNYDDFESKHSENLLDVLARAGIQVLWRDNNSGCKGVCDRIPSQTTASEPLPELCNADGCFDEILLHRLQLWLDQQQGDVFIVLHQQGSHGPEYYKRYPPRFRKFEPECRSNMPQDCTQQEIVNAYDNSIVYTDYFLSQVINFLKGQQQYRSAMLYVSDHGESLGENGLYLHGFPYVLAPEEQTHVPFVLWFSPGFARSQELNRKCLETASSNTYSHDNIFDSVLGLFKVQTQIYQPEKDLFSACRTGNTLLAESKPTSSFK